MTYKGLYLFLAITSSWAYIGCGTTSEYVSHDTTVTDHLVTVDIPDVHVTLQGVIRDSVIIATTPDSVKKRPWVRTHTNIHTGVVQVDVLMPDTTVTSHDTTRSTTTTVIETPGLFSEIKDVLVYALGFLVLAGLVFGGLKLAKTLKLI